MISKSKFQKQEVDVHVADQDKEDQIFGAICFSNHKTLMTIACLESNTEYHSKRTPLENWRNRN